MGTQSRSSHPSGSASFRTLLILTAVALAATAAGLMWVRAAPQVSLNVLAGVRVEYLLTPGQAGQISRTLGPDFEVTENEAIIIRGSDSLVALEPKHEGLVATELEPTKPPPDSFTLDRGPVLLTVSGQFFGQLEEGGYSKAITLPRPGMKLGSSANAGTVYLFGPITDDAHRLYTFYEDGVLDILLELPTPIVGVADNRHAMYVATAREIIRILPQALGVVLRLPDDESPITSIATTPDDRVVYFSTAERVYAFTGLAAIALVTNGGGTLRVRDGKLYLFDTTYNILVALAGIEEALFRPGP